MSFLGFGKKQKPGGPGPMGPGGPPGVGGPQDKGGIRGTGAPSGIPTAAQPGHTPSSMNNSINSLNTGGPVGDPANFSRNRGDQEGAPFNRTTPTAPQNGAAVSNLYPWSQRQLSFLNPQANPFPRYGAAVNSLASKDGDIYVMGGLVNAQSVKGDLWIIDAGKGLTCEPVKTEAEGPGPRVGHASLLVGNAFIVFGGDTKQNEDDPLDDTLYLLNTSTRQWSRALPPGPRPSGRYGHTINILGSKLFVFGGQVDGHFFNDLVAFDLNQLQEPTNRWEVLIEDKFENEKTGLSMPPGRTNHTVVTYNDKLYLFGGTDGVQWFNDVWTYDPQSNSWAQQDCIGYIPQPREGHSAALCGDVMYIFGGRTVEGNDLGDLAAFRITSRRWYTFQNMGPAPSPRSGHSMTAFDKQIIVCAGEPSSPERDPTELSLVYILDTSKIRYPNDQQIYSTPAGERVAGNTNTSTARRPSTDRNGNRIPQPMRDSQQTGGSPQQIGSRLPRVAGPSAGPGPPPQQQAPPPRMNGSSIPTAGAQRTRTPTIGENRGYGPPQGQARGPPADRALGERPDSRRDVSGPPSRSMSPAVDQNGSQNQGAKYGAVAAEEAAAASIIATQQRQMQSEQVQGREPPASQPRGVFQEAPEPAGVPKGESDALLKEVEELRTRNAWFASELSAARKAGYDSSSAKRMSTDGVTKTLKDNDKPFVEALMALRGELSNLQSTANPNVEDALKKVAEMERQRDAAIREAAYAKAKLAAHGGSQAGTPQLDDSTRDIENDRTAAHSHQLSNALSLQSELQGKVEALKSQLAAESRAREVAEDNAEDAQRRFADLDKDRNPAEVESLRAELHALQRQAREEAAQRTDAQGKLRILQLDKEEAERQLADVTSTTTNHGTMLTSLREALTASQDKYSLLEKKLQQERETQESVQRKLISLRTEHEERTSELETMTRKLRDAEELADKHAAEAETHRQVVISGLDRLNVSGGGSESQRAISEKRVAVLQDQVDGANELVAKSQAEAEAASEKLRRAEERIAGLEAYQQQASREGVGIRKQLQEALRSAQTFQSQHSDLKQQLETHQRDANALAIQHGALKDLLDERSASAAAASRNLDSPSGGRLGSPDTVRLRELESRLEDARRTQMEMKAHFESSQQESEKAFQEKIEQLEQDYQSAVSYVKGTEKMLKRMKDELNKSKAQTTRLQTELDRSQTQGGAGAAAAALAGGAVAGGRNTPAEWEAERQGLRKEIEEMQDTMKGSVYQLQQQMDEVRAELEAVQEERDEAAAANSQLERQAAETQAHLDKMRGDSKMLESRALDAEAKVALLLDQVESSVDNYRRQSQNMHAAAAAGAGAHVAQRGHKRNDTASSSTSTALGHSAANSIGGESNFSGTDRNSLALDNLASELETLRTQWEGAHRSYRLSNNFDFTDRTGGPGGSGAGPAGAQGGSGEGALSSHLASWRKRLEAEERDKERMHAAGQRGVEKPEGMNAF